MAGHLVTGHYLAHLRDDLGAGFLGRGTAGAEPAAGGRVQRGRLAPGDPDALPLHSAAQLGGDRAFLASLTDEVLRSGTSELRSWIVAGTAARQAGLAGELVDYQPCYRSEAGTGNAMGFVTWA